MSADKDGPLAVGYLMNTTRDRRLRPRPVPLAAELSTAVLEASPTGSEAGASTAFNEACSSASLALSRASQKNWKNASSGDIPKPSSITRNVNSSIRVVDSLLRGVLADDCAIV